MNVFWSRRTAVAIAAGLALDADAPAESDYNREKATLFYNFLRFAEWPLESLPAPGDSLPVCVLGDHASGRALRQRVQGQPLFVREIPEPKDALACRILFIDESDQRRVGAIIKAVRGRAVLTVGDRNGFAAQGGVVSLIMDRGQVRFPVNLAAAGRQNLAISSRILMLSEIVRQ